jgi:aryl-alcohol dehydrogenase-like predicted oxidoreductase
LSRVQGPARRTLEARAAFRASARTKAAGPARGMRALLCVSSGHGRSTARMRLERILRVLKTDRVDPFLLQDPTVDQMPVGGLGECLEEAKQDGIIGTWGAAGEPAATLRVRKVS